MDLLLELLLVLHLLGWALVLGGLAVTIRERRIPTAAFHGLLTAIVTGVAMAGVGAASGTEDYNEVKLTVKLLVALAATGLVVYGRRRPEKVTTGLIGAALGLTALNVALAVLW
jgi:hypothetical protein